MEILNKEVVEATKKKLDEEIKDKVTLIFFTQEPSRLIVPDRLKGKNASFARKQENYSRKSALSPKK